MSKINQTVLVSGAEYFTDKDAINALMDSKVLVDKAKAIKEHQLIVKAFKEAGIKVIKVAPPKNCQDGIYTANWGLVRNGKVVLSRLPNKRQPEEVYAKKVLTKLGLSIYELPDTVKAFSGQGDAIACGDILFIQSPYRTSVEAHEHIKNKLGFKQVISLQTKPARWFKIGPSKKNKITGWPDSPTYDIDLAIALIKPKIGSNPPLIAYCPDVFNLESLDKIQKLSQVDKITVSKTETLDGFALNLVSTGETVVMNSGAPLFKDELLKRGLKVTELDLSELKKGGGSIRCSSLTLD